MFGSLVHLLERPAKLKILLAFPKLGDQKLN